MGGRQLLFPMMGETPPVPEVEDASLLSLTSPGCCSFKTESSPQPYWPPSFPLNFISVCLQLASAQHPSSSQSTSYSLSTSSREACWDPETARHEARPAGGGRHEVTAQGSYYQVPREW